MTVTLCMIVRDAAPVLPRCLASLEGLIDHWLIVDTGSEDNTRGLVAELLADIPGELVERRWQDYGANRTEALELAGAGGEGWVLMLDADMTVEAHPGLLGWLQADPDPEADAWLVEVLEAGLLYRLPLLTRAGLAWRYEGRAHEYLDPAGRKRRPLLGLTVTHHADAPTRAGKHERDLELLAADMAAGDPRATFYSADALRCLGRSEEAADLYRARAAMPGFEEEAWYAEYRAALLDGSPLALVKAWQRRPWRHEPLAAAARLIAAEPNSDLLFMEARVA